MTTAPTIAPIALPGGTVYTDQNGRRACDPNALRDTDPTRPVEGLDDLEILYTEDDLDELCATFGVTV